MRYIIIYRDGGIGYPRKWNAMLDQIEKVIRDLPYPFWPIAVVTEYEYNRALARLNNERG